MSNLNVTARVEAPAGLTSEQIAALGGGGAAVLAVLLVLLLGLMVVVRRRRMPNVNMVDQGVQADELLANVPHRSHSFTSIYGSGRLASDVGAAARRTSQHASAARARVLRRTRTRGRVGVGDAPSSEAGGTQCTPRGDSEPAGGGGDGEEGPPLGDSHALPPLAV